MRQCHLNNTHFYYYYYYYYELVLGTSWLGYELAWYDLVRVRVERHPRTLTRALKVTIMYAVQNDTEIMFNIVFTV